MSVGSVSVVVPTRDRPRQLARCLSALAAQVGVELDVVVVDDGSRDPSGPGGAVGDHAGIRLLRLEGLGPAAARNAGVRAARSDVVLLLDDDCVPEPDWAAELGAAAARERQLVAGRTVHDPGSALVAASELIVDYVERRTAFAATRNVGLLRSLAIATPFDEQFVEAAGEDRDWCRRLAASGVGIARAPRAVVRHAPELRLGGFLRQHARYGRASRVLGREGRRQGPGFYGGLVAEGFARGARVGLAVLLAQAATAGGWVGRPTRRRLR